MMQTMQGELLSYHLHQQDALSTLFNLCGPAFCSRLKRGQVRVAIEQAQPILCRFLRGGTLCTSTGLIFPFSQVCVLDAYKRPRKGSREKEAAARASRSGKSRRGRGQGDAVQHTPKHKVASCAS